MIFPCRVYDKNGILIKEHSVEELSERYWSDSLNPEFKRFSEAAYQNIKYAENKIDINTDYIPDSDLGLRNNKKRGNLLIKELRNGSPGDN